MLIKRDNRWVEDGTDLVLDGTVKTLDYLDNLERLEEVPVLREVSSKSRKRITSITKPISRLLKGRKKKEKS